MESADLITQRLRRAIADDDAVELSRALALDPQRLSQPLTLGRSALLEAARSGRRACAAALARLGADPNERDELGWTPWLLCARDGNLDALRWMAPQARSRDANGEGANAAMAAAGRGRLDCLRFLLLEADPGLLDCRDPEGHGPLVWAAHEGWLDCVEFLLGLGDDPNQAGFDGLTPLGAACRRGRARCVHLLLRAGADPSRADAEGRSPADQARFWRKPQCAAIVEAWALRECASAPRRGAARL